MRTTTIRIEDELKSRLTSAADRAGTTAHAFILGAIEQVIEQSELEAEFHDLAESRWANLLKTGKSVSLEDASAYLAGKARGEHPRKPAARRLKR